MKTKKFLAMIVAVMMLSGLTTMFAYAASDIESASYWQSVADGTTNYRTYKDVGEFARALSRQTSNVQTDGAVKFPMVLVNDGTAYYFNGSEYAIPTGATYTKVPAPSGGARTVTGPSETSNTGLSVDIHVYSGAGAAEAKPKVVAAVNANLLNASGITPDTGGAMGIFSGIMPMINILLGIIVTVISVGMTIFTALDIIYLAFPAFREKVDSSVESGGKGSKTNKDGSKGSRFVTDDAVQAVKEAEEANGQPWGGYLKRRVVAFIFLAVILFIMLTGNIFQITTMVTNALSGIFNSLGIG